MHCYSHVAHGTNLLYTSVWSLRNLRSLGLSVLCCANSVETNTSVYYKPTFISHYYVVPMYNKSHIE